MDRKDDAKRFLARWGIDIDQLTAHAPPVGPGECLALAGSIGEGLANEESDIDLLYIGDTPLSDKIVIRADYTFGVSHDQNGREINVEQVTSQDLDELSARMERTLHYFHDPKARTRELETNPGRLKLLHRIKTAIPLVNAEVLAAGQERLRLSELHLFMCLRFVQDVMNYLEDIVGEVEAGRPDSAAWITRTLFAPALVAAMLTSVGETNGSPKWHHRLLKRHAADLGKARVDQVLAFLEEPWPAREDDPLGSLSAVADLVLGDIYERRRDIRRSALAFRITVRYTDPNQRRWTRRTGAAVEVA